jgi:hypothetical protein
MDKNPAIIIAVFVRLFAIGLVIYLLQVLGLEYSAAANFEDYKVNLVLGVIVAFVALLAVFLWKFPLFVASKLLNFESTEIPKASISEESIYNLGLVLLGIFLLYLAISDTVYWSYRISAERGLTQFTSELGFLQKASMLTALVEFIMAVLLIVGSKPIARLILKIRRAGL